MSLNTCHPRKLRRALPRLRQDIMFGALFAIVLPGAGRAILVIVVSALWTHVLHAAAPRGGGSSRARGHQG